MKFCEAMDAMKNGAKVTRQQWAGSVYFMMVKSDVKSYQPALDIYQYDENIMVSDGWMVEGIDQPVSFCDAVEPLMKGKKARLKDWPEDSFIKYDYNAKSLTYSCMKESLYAPSFQEFSATDWMTIQ